MEDGWQLPRRATAPYNPENPPEVESPNPYAILAHSENESQVEAMERPLVPYSPQWAAQERARCLAQVRTRREKILGQGQSQDTSRKRTKAQSQSHYPILVNENSLYETEVNKNSLYETEVEVRVPSPSPVAQSVPRRIEARVPSPSPEVQEEDVPVPDPKFPVAIDGCAEWAPPLERPHRASYFLPGKLERRPLHYLIDTGCNTNLISKKTFDGLPERVRATLERHDKFGILADGSKLAFYGVIKLTGRVRDVQIEEVFVVSQINEDAILGMPFLATHSCKMEFDEPTIVVKGRKLQCTDRYGRLLVAQVQVWREVTV